MPSPAQAIEEYVTAETLDAKLPEWLAAVVAYEFRETTPLDASAGALLVVDMTRPFVDADRPLGTPAARAIIGRVGGLVGAFRSADRPVIWLAQGHHSVAHDRGELLANWWPDSFTGSADDTAPAEGLEPAEGEKVVLKRRYSGFTETDLDLTLRCLGVRSVVVCGVLTNVCPFATAMDAFVKGYRVYYPPDATGAFNEQLHVSALCTASGWFAHVTPVATIRQWLGE